MAKLVDARDLKSVLSTDSVQLFQPAVALDHIENNANGVELHNVSTHVYRWNRQGRKGQLCKVTARGKMNSIRVEFQDGYVMITSGNAIRRAPLL